MVYCCVQEKGRNRIILIGTASAAAISTELVSGICEKGSCLPVGRGLYLCHMADVHNKKTRSYNMSQIKSGNTKPEMLVRKFLHAHGFRYSLHKKTLPGKPDIVLPKYKTVIFVNGCFWHGHANCKYFVVPKTRTKWWLRKIAANKANDEKAVKALRKEGWKVIAIWECRLKPAKSERTLSSLLRKLQ